MVDTIYSNTQMLAWMGYFTDKMGVSPEKVKLLNICSRKKNVLPSIETHKWVMIFADESHKNLCYDIWEAGLGECEIWYGHGLNPGQQVQHNTIKEMSDYELKEPTVLFISNENARDSYKIGIKNENFSRGTVHYVGNEIRAVIMSMLSVDTQDVICIVSGESIVIEAAVIAGEGTIIAVEPNQSDMATLKENVGKFGVHNVEIIADTKEIIQKELSVPRLAFIVASSTLEADIQNLLKVNPKMQFIIYTLELDILAEIKPLFAKYHIKNMEVIQITVSKMNKDSMFVTQPSPWMISGEA